MLIGWIESNLTNMFTDVNEKVGTIAAEVGQTPSGWNGGVSRNLWNFFRTAPAGTGQAVTCSTSGMGLRLK